jgi:hypothetical protein
MESNGTPKLPRLTKGERKKLRLVYTLLIIAALLGTAVVVWLAWVNPARQSAGINSYEECVAAGYAVQESSPPVCVTPDGTSFTGPPAQQPDY